MSENMIEMVAKAIYALDPLQDQEADLDGRAIGPVYDIPWDKAAEWDEGWREHVIAQARAAIEAMQAKPTEAMILAGYQALMDWDARTGEDHGIFEIWQAMFGDALSAVPVEQEK